MATVSGSASATTIPAREHFGSALNSVVSTFAHPTTGDGSAAGDIIEMVKVPKGAVVLEVWLTSEDLDTSTAPAIELDVGDGGDVDRFIDGATIGQAGGIVRLGSGVAAAAMDGAFGFAYTVDDTIDVKVVAAAGTKAAGTITLGVLYAMQA